jgi:hypothetical protein
MDRMDICWGAYATYLFLVCVRSCPRNQEIMTCLGYGHLFLPVFIPPSDLHDPDWPLSLRGMFTLVIKNPNDWQPPSFGGILPCCCRGQDAFTSQLLFPLGQRGCGVCVVAGCCVLSCETTELVANRLFVHSVLVPQA